MATIDADELPWLIDIQPNMTPISHVTWNTHSIDGEIYNSYLESSTAQNSEASFNVVLAAGTWTLELMSRTSGNMGIYTVQLDGTTVGTIDAYGSVAYNVRLSITGITVGATGKKVLRFWMNTKNASSTGYLGTLKHIQLRRTA